MKTIRYFIIFSGLLLVLTACNAAANEEPVPSETAETVAEAATEPATAVPTTAATMVPGTNTPAPEPATATLIPTSTIADQTEEAIPSATSVENEPDTTPESEITPGSETAVTASPAETVEAQATNTAPANTLPPAAPSGVPNVNNSDYPAVDDRAGWENRILVPEGFEVTYYGRIDGNPTSITFGPDGLLYIAQQQGNILTMSSNGSTNVYASGFGMPTGIAFRPGTSDLYVSDRPNIQNTGGEAQVSIVGRGQLIGDLPCCYVGMHSAQGITFGPDGYGYVGVGARADHGEILDGSGLQDERHPLEAIILRFNPDTGEHSVYAKGLRNPYDHTWDANNQMWATDNTPDFDPPEELHRVVPGAEHGYPWYDCDVCFNPPAGVEVLPPTVTFPASSSPTGIIAYLDDQFPGYYNSLFVTLWSAFPAAQKVVHVGPGGTAPHNFATGLAAPIDVTVGPDGSLFVADWATGIIFKISYTG